MKRIFVAGALVLMALGTALTAMSLHATSGALHRTVRTAGGETFAANQRVSASLRFIPGDIQIRTGGTLDLQHGDTTQEPHTLSIVNQSDLPASIDDVFNCGAPGTICDTIFSSLGDNPGAFTEGTGTGTGLDGNLDTMWINPGQTVSATVTAPAGTILYFLCAIHPWMQGRIIVTD